MVRGLILAAVACAGSCGKRGAPEQAPPPPQVSVFTVETRTIPVSYAYVGQTGASKEVEVRSRVAGFVMKRPFEEGGQVDEGDLLFKIDPRQYEADLAVARARQAEAEARLMLAQATLKRIQAAAAQGGTNAQEVDERSAQVKEAAAQLDLAKGNVSNADLNLSYCTIVSPLRGRVSRSPVYEGAYVDGGAGSLLASVVQSDPIYVNVNISEREVLKWQADIASGRIVLPSEGQQGMRVGLTLIDGTPYRHEGVFNFIDIRVNPQTGTAAVRTEFPNPDDRLRPGQFVKARFVGAQRPGTMTVPQRAVISNPTGHFVLLVGEGNKAELRRVVLAEWTEDDWIVDQGLKAGDRVIVEGMIGVAPGAVVQIVPAGAASGAGASSAPGPGGPGAKGGPSATEAKQELGGDGGTDGAGR